MYIWVAIDIDEQLGCLRQKVLSVTRTLSSDNPALTLPLHISLRISFPVEDQRFDMLIESLVAYYRSLRSFDIDVLGVEKSRNNVIWVRMAENEALTRTHNDIVEFLQNDHGIPPHMFDRSFRYHATLFMDDDEAKTDKAYDFLKDSPIPGKVRAKKFVIGCSETGVPGNYRVIREELVQ